MKLFARPVVIVGAAFVLQAGCSLTSLDGYAGSAAEDAAAVSDAASSDGDRPGPLDARVESAANDASADAAKPPPTPWSCGIDAVFCTVLPGPALAEWSMIQELGGKMSLDPTTALSPPNGLRAMMPATSPLGIGGYAAASAKVPSPSHVVDEVTFAFRHTGMPSASVGIARFTMGAASNALALTVSTTASSLVVEYAYGATAPREVAAPVPLPPPGVWSRITLRAEHAMPSVVTLIIDDVTMFAQKPTTSSSYGYDIVLELGLVSVAPGTDANDIRYDDIAIRRR